MYTQNGRALQIGRGNNRSLGFYGVAGVGRIGDFDPATAAINSDGSGSVAPGGYVPPADSITQNITQYDASLYPSSAANNNSSGNGAPKSNTSNTSLLFIVAGVAGLFIMLAGGRR